MTHDSDGIRYGYNGTYITFKVQGIKKYPMSL